MEDGEQLLGNSDTNMDTVAMEMGEASDGATSDSSLDSDDSLDGGGDVPGPEISDPGTKNTDWLPHLPGGILKTGDGSNSCHSSSNHGGSLTSQEPAESRSSTGACSPGAMGNTTSGEGLCLDPKHLPAHAHTLLEDQDVAELSVESLANTLAQQQTEEQCGEEAESEGQSEAGGAGLSDHVTDEEADSEGEVGVNESLLEELNQVDLAALLPDVNVHPSTGSGADQELLAQLSTAVTAAAPQQPDPHADMQAVLDSQMMRETLAAMAGLVPPVDMHTQGSPLHPAHPDPHTTPSPTSSHAQPVCSTKTTPTKCHKPASLSHRQRELSKDTHTPTKATPPKRTNVSDSVSSKQGTEQSVKTKRKVGRPPKDKSKASPAKTIDQYFIPVSQGCNVNEDSANPINVEPRIEPPAAELHFHNMSNTSPDSGIVDINESPNDQEPLSPHHHHHGNQHGGFSLANAQEVSGASEEHDGPPVLENMREIEVPNVFEFSREQPVLEREGFASEHPQDSDANVVCRSKRKSKKSLAFLEMLDSKRLLKAKRKEKKERKIKRPVGRPRKNPLPSGNERTNREENIKRKPGRPKGSHKKLSKNRLHKQLEHQSTANSEESFSWPQKAVNGSGCDSGGLSSVGLTSALSGDNQLSSTSSGSSRRTLIAPSKFGSYMKHLERESFDNSLAKGSLVKPKRGPGRPRKSDKAVSQSSRVDSLKEAKRIKKKKVPTATLR